tara:strand:+ start:671 stop:1144 length:474 start_codon:yes stop_codon:yes gene_type:complete
MAELPTLPPLEGVELPTLPLAELVTDFHLIVCQFAIQRGGELTRVRERLGQWVAAGGGRLAEAVTKSQYLFALRRGGELGVTPGDFLVAVYARLHRHLDLLFDSMANCGTDPVRLAEEVIAQDDGLAALESVELLRTRPHIIASGERPCKRTCRRDE